MREPEEQQTADGMFIRQDYPTIMSGWVVRYKIRTFHSDCQINASRDGWSLSGDYWPVMQETETFIHTIHKAYLIYRALNGRSASYPIPEETVEQLARKFQTEDSQDEQE